MHAQDRDRLIRSIYDAALDPSGWPAMLTRVARAMDCEQCNFVISDPVIGTTQVITPMWREDYRDTFFAHWHKEFTITPKLRLFPVGKPVNYEELFDVEWLRKTEFYNDWWLPQGVGGGSFAANLVKDGDANASITVHAGTGKQGFTSAERELFQDIVGHLARSVAILRRLQMARLVTSQAEAHLASGFAVVDRTGLILHSDQPTLQWLDRLGVVEPASALGRIASLSVRSLLTSAITRANGGHLDLLERSGGRVRLSVIPCSPTEAFDPFVIDRPAALIWLISTDQIRRERTQRLVAAHSLTEAEARIAMEACRGGGRAEIAKRCGLSPHTVRTHLEAIYWKTGVHRQAELVRLVETI